MKRLAAILAADVVGYSKLIGEDEAGTLAALRHLRREVFPPIIEAHDGHLIKSMGDGWLIEFPSAGEAVSCAIDVQRALADHETISLRIGLHVGDVTFEDDDIYGDGVNIAARLQELAEPNAIVISDFTRRSIDGKLALGFEDLGTQALKNIAEPVAAYGWGMAAIELNVDKTHLALPDKPSIAVLPFNNLSSDAEQDYFADGIVEDLITALSRFPWLFVIARNSSFTYKGQHVSVKKVAAELGVRYVVEGSVRSSPNRLRVTVQLIDAIHDSHVWAENYDRPTGDLFDLQDEITQSITGVLVPALGSAERERALRDNRPKLDAWRAYQIGLAHYYQPYSDETHAAARRYFDQAVELDPSFSDAWSMIALMGIYAIISGQSSYTASFDEVLAETKRAAERAVQLDDRNAIAHTAIGRVYQLQGNFNHAVAECQTAVNLNPNLAISHHELGFVLGFAGKFDLAVASHDQAIQLSPNDPSSWNFHLIKSLSQYGAGDYEGAISSVSEAARLRPANFWPYVFMAGSLFALGRIKEAEEALREVLARKPDCTMTFLRSLGEKNDTEVHYSGLLKKVSEVGILAQ